MILCNHYTLIQRKENNITKLYEKYMVKKGFPEIRSGWIKVITIICLPATTRVRCKILCRYKCTYI